MMPHWDIHNGDALAVLKTLDSNSVDCCVTSPPYFRLRNYDCEGQIGLEETISEYLEKLVIVFREMRRVLKPTGSLWLNMGDGYVSDAWGGGGNVDTGTWGDGKRSVTWEARRAGRGKRPKPKGLKCKDMMGIPWRLAFALQDDGWILRQDIIWKRPNPLPEAVKDRCTKAHEYVFLFSRSRKYYFDADAIAEPVTGNAHDRGQGVNPKALAAETERAFNRRRKTEPSIVRSRQNPSFSAAVRKIVADTRHPRSVWTIPTQPRKDSHFASFPDELARRCIVAGCPKGGVVIDPFVGRGTTVVVALRNQRNGIGIDLSSDYCEMSRRNIIDDAPLLNMCMR